MTTNEKLFTSISEQEIKDFKDQVYEMIQSLTEHQRFLGTSALGLRPNWEVDASVRGLKSHLDLLLPLLDHNKLLYKEES